MFAIPIFRMLVVITIIGTKIYNCYNFFFVLIGFDKFLLKFIFNFIFLGNVK